MSNREFIKFIDHYKRTFLNGKSVNIKGSWKPVGQGFNICNHMLKSINYKVEIKIKDRTDLNKVRKVTKVMIEKQDQNRMKEVKKDFLLDNLKYIGVRSIDDDKIVLKNKVVLPILPIKTIQQVVSKIYWCKSLLGHCFLINKVRRVKKKCLDCYTSLCEVGWGYRNISDQVTQVSTMIDKIISNTKTSSLNTLWKIADKHDFNNIVSKMILNQL